MAVSVDSPEELQIMRSSSTAEFTFLSDPDGQLMDLLDVRHAGGRMDGVDIPQSASFLITPEGEVVWYKLAQNYRLRPLPEEILTVIDQRLGS